MDLDNVTLDDFSEGEFLTLLVSFLRNHGQRPKRFELGVFVKAAHVAKCELGAACPNFER